MSADMPDVEKCEWIQAWLGRGRECTGKFAAENIKEAAMQMLRIVSACTHYDQGR